MATKKNEQIIEIKPLEIEEVEIRITGITPLIMHAWSEKAKKQIREPKGPHTKNRGPRKPIEDFIDSMYWLTAKPKEDTMESFNEAIKTGAMFGFPVTAIKQAAISGAYRGGMTKDKASI
ncbi:MAG: hypothetical protein PHD46_07530, partial [Eubacteriales bacterium]|nr:hypothetical protein [Eubacteriales bacterium]